MRLNPVILAMAAVEKPLIAAINGVIAGAGLGFAGSRTSGVCRLRGLCAGDGQTPSSRTGGAI